jgi:hypothetical protein
MADQNDLTTNVAIHDEATDNPNVAIHDEATDNPVTTTVDGSKRRLDVDASISGGNFQLTPFTPEFHYSVANTALNTSTDTSLYSETDTGKIDFVCIAGSNSNFEVIIKVDGVELLRIPMTDLGTLGLSNATNVPLWAETANKNFRYSPKQGVDFTTSFEILAKATATPTPTVNWLINDRKQGSI